MSTRRAKVPGNRDPQADLLRRADAHIRALRNASMGLLGRFFADAPVSATEAIMMERVYYRTGLAQSELAGLLGVDPGLVSRMVSRLTKIGLAETLHDDTDRRVRRVHLTDSGRMLFEKDLAPRFTHFMQDRMGALTPDRIQRLLDILEEIADALGVTVEES